MRPRWNVMICRAGDNNLSSEMVRAIDGIARTNTGANTVSVHFDPLSPHIPAQRHHSSRGVKTVCPAVQTKRNDEDVTQFRLDAKAKSSANTDAWSNSRTISGT